MREAGVGAGADVVDPGPGGRVAAQPDAGAAEGILKQPLARLDDGRIGLRQFLIGGGGLGDERADAHHELGAVLVRIEARLDRVAEIGHCLDVVVVLVGQADHEVELEPSHRGRADAIRRFEDLLLRDLLVDPQAHALGAGFRGERDGAGAAAGEDLEEARVEVVDAQGADRDARPHCVGLDGEFGEFGVVGHGGAEQSDPLGAFEPAPDLADQRFERAVARRAEDVAGDAEAAAAPAAARSLDQRHPVELGVLGQDMRHRLRGGDIAHPLALDAVGRAQGRHEDARNAGERGQQVCTRPPGVLRERVHQLVEDRFGLADHQRVEAVGERERVGDYGRAAADHDRVALAAPDRERRDARRLQRADDVVVVDFVGEGVGDQREVGQRTLRFDRDRGAFGFAPALPSRRRFIERTLACYIRTLVQQ